MLERSEHPMFAGKRERERERDKGGKRGRRRRRKGVKRGAKWRDKGNIETNLTGFYSPVSFPSSPSLLSLVVAFAMLRAERRGGRHRGVGERHTRMYGIFFCRQTTRVTSGRATARRASWSSNQPTNQLGVKERRTTTTPRRNRWREKEKERVKRRKDRGGGSVFWSNYRDLETRRFIITIYTRILLPLSH